MQHASKQKFLENYKIVKLFHYTKTINPLQTKELCTRKLQENWNSYITLNVKYGTFINHTVWTTAHILLKSVLPSNNSSTVVKLYICLRCRDKGHLSMTWVSVCTRRQGHSLSSKGRRPRPRRFQRPFSAAKECALKRSLVQETRSTALICRPLVVYISYTDSFDFIFL